MNAKSTKFSLMMRDVASCTACIARGCGIRDDKRLINLIKQRPEGPRYGEIPTRYTDWEYRLDAKIAFVLQDWGAAKEARSLRGNFQRLMKKHSCSELAWRLAVTHREPSRTDERLSHYLRMSAEKENLRLPDWFLDNIFFTNSVLCFKQGDKAEGNKHIDLRRSIRNCKRFLLQQLEIVKPEIVVALGGGALQALHFPGKLGAAIQEAKESRHGFIEHEYEGRPLKLVPLLHPTAHVPAGSTHKKQHNSQIESYRLIWKALLSVHGKKLIEECFPNPW